MQGIELDYAGILTIFTFECCIDSGKAYITHQKCFIEFSGEFHNGKYFSGENHETRRRGMSLSDSGREKRDIVKTLF
jgi:hypothetical protein